MHDSLISQESSFACAAMLSIALAIFGVVLLCLLVADIYVTVFVPRGRVGVIARRTYSSAWMVWRKVGSRLPPERRRIWLSQFGPLLVPVTVIVWGALLILSFALIYAPWVSQFSISPPESGPMPDWAIALYYSGYSAVTLGVGDVTANGTAPRLLAVVEAGFGFAIITASISYLLSVYSARNQATVVALAISRFVGRGDGRDPVDLLVATSRTGTDEEISNWFELMSMQLVNLAELEGQYPLINYFHEPSDARALPIAIADLLELVTICRSLLSPEHHAALALGPTTRAVERIATAFLTEPATIDAEGEDELGDDRRRRYVEVRARLEDAGIPLRPDDEAWAIYAAVRSQWDVADELVRDWLGYRSTTESD